MDKLRDEWKVSTRGACSALRIDRSLYVYKSKRSAQAELTHRIKEICETRVRYWSAAGFVDTEIGYFMNPEVAKTTWA